MGDTIEYGTIRPPANEEELWKWNELVRAFLGKPNIPGDVDIGGDLAVTGDGSIGGDLVVVGDQTIGGDLVVTGDTTSNKYTLSKARFEDIQVSVSTARMPAVNSPTWRTFAYAIGGGIAYFTLGFAINDFIEFKVQTFHAVELSTILENHIHWTIPSDSLGDKIKFQIDTIYANQDEDYAVPAGSPFSAETTLDGTESGKHNVLDIAEIPAVNTEISAIYVMRLTRVAASSDDYANEVYIDFDDSHVSIDTPGGSETDDTKN